MKHSLYFFLFIILLLTWGCDKGSGFEYPITPDFDGKFVFGRQLSGGGSGQVGTEIFTFNQAAETQITTGCQQVLCQKAYAEWIYPGHKIVYHFNGYPGNGGYYMMDEDGANDHLLIADDVSSNHYAADATEDGNLFACFSNEQLGIFQIDSDTLKIIDSLDWSGDGSVQFSPNNELVLVYDFPLFQGLRLGIHRIGQPGIISYTMPNGDANVDNPDFSYLSDKIVFELEGDIWVIDSEGNHAEKIIDSPKDFELTPVWSPVENCFAFSRQPYKHPNEPSELILYNYSSRTETVILSTKNVTFIVDIKWSADGQQIAFHNHNEKETNLGTFIINKDGTGLKRISNELFPYDDWFTE